MNDINSIGNARLIIREVSKVIVGKDESLIKILLAIIAGGHILMEDIPGVGKTTMASSAWTITVSSLRRTSCPRILRGFRSMTRKPAR